MKFICSAPYLPSRSSIFFDASDVSVAFVRSIPLRVLASQCPWPLASIMASYVKQLVSMLFGYVWIALLKSRSKANQPTNQPNRSPFGRWETKLADEASSPKRLRRLVSADASRRTLTTCCLCNKKVQKVLHIHSNQ